MRGLRGGALMAARAYAADALDTRRCFAVVTLIAALLRAAPCAVFRLFH
jgi:hypothetical protein